MQMQRIFYKASTMDNAHRTKYLISHHPQLRLNMFLMSAMRCRLLSSVPMWKAPVISSFFEFWISTIFSSMELLVMNL